MTYRIATLAAAALLLAAAPSFAAYAPAGATNVPASVINAGPQVDPWSTDGSSAAAQAELDYLHQVCPTVLAHPGQYNANLTTFCHETPRG